MSSIVNGPNLGVSNLLSPPWTCLQTRGFLLYSSAGLAVVPLPPPDPTPPQPPPPGGSMETTVLCPLSGVTGMGLSSARTLVMPTAISRLSLGQTPLSYPGRGQFLKNFSSLHPILRHKLGTQHVFSGSPQKTCCRKWSLGMEIVLKLKLMLFVCRG